MDLSIILCLRGCYILHYCPCYLIRCYQQRAHRRTTTIVAMSCCSTATSFATLPAMPAPSFSLPSPSSPTCVRCNRSLPIIICVPSYLPTIDNVSPHAFLLLVMALNSSECSTLTSYPRASSSYTMLPPLPPTSSWPLLPLWLSHPPWCGGEGELAFGRAAARVATNLVDPPWTTLSPLHCRELHLPQPLQLWFLSWCDRSDLGHCLPYLMSVMLVICGCAIFDLLLVVTLDMLLHLFWLLGGWALHQCCPIDFADNQCSCEVVWGNRSVVLWWIGWSFPLICYGGVVVDNIIMNWHYAGCGCRGARNGLMTLCWCSSCWGIVGKWMIESLSTRIGVEIKEKT